MEAVGVDAWDEGLLAAGWTALRCMGHRPKLVSSRWDSSAAPIRHWTRNQLRTALGNLRAHLKTVMLKRAGESSAGALERAAERHARRAGLRRGISALRCRHLASSREAMERAASIRERCCLERALAALHVVCVSRKRAAHVAAALSKTRQGLAIMWWRLYAAAAQSMEDGMLSLFTYWSKAHSLPNHNPKMIDCHAGTVWTRVSPEHLCLC